MERFGSMIVKVFSKVDFVNSLLSNHITDDNVEQSGQYFICIDSTGGPRSAAYFEQSHNNVIRLVFDDVEEDAVMWGNDIQAHYDAVAMTMPQAVDLYEFIKTIPKNSTINIHCAKGQSRSVAVQSFLFDKEQGNPHVLRLLRQARELFN